MSSTPTRVNPFANIDTPIDDFTPRPATLVTPAAPGSAQAIAKTSEKKKLTELAQSSGFTIDNYKEVPLPGRIPKETKETFTKTIRFNVSDWNKFADWCHENNYTLIRGFELLTEHLPRPSKK
jgi:hypothetical protein